MSVGKSGRIVIEIEPDLKKELHDTLKRDGKSLKEWFLVQANSYLVDSEQLNLPLNSNDKHSKGRRLNDI